MILAYGNRTAKIKNKKKSKSTYNFIFITFFEKQHQAGKYLYLTYEKRRLKLSLAKWVN